MSRQGFDRLQAVGRNVGAVAEFLEYGQGHLLVGGIVFGQQDAARRVGLFGRPVRRMQFGTAVPDLPEAVSLDDQARHSCSWDWRSGLVR